MRENFNSNTVVYVAGSRALVAFYYGPPIRSVHGPIRAGSRAPHKNGNSRAQRLPTIPLII